jgi:hypothetical protein
VLLVLTLCFHQLLQQAVVVVAQWALLVVRVVRVAVEVVAVLVARPHLAKVAQVALG